ncbi:MAG: DUF1799 domain-containing protein [Burkholderiales bacterium]|nr:DUF1799 domain-containing protein [Burkholderiales bacterium]
MRAAGAQRRLPNFWLWPDHVPALRLWFQVGTQWRTGPAGAIGLDYTGVEAVCRIEGLRGADRRERFAELQVLERATLKVWAEQRAAAAARLPR